MRGLDSVCDEGAVDPSVLHYWQPGLPVPPIAIPFSTVPLRLSCIPPFANPSHPAHPMHPILPYLSYLIVS